MENVIKYEQISTQVSSNASEVFFIEKNTPNAPSQGAFPSVGFPVFLCTLLYQKFATLLCFTVPVWQNSLLAKLMKKS